MHMVDTTVVHFMIFEAVGMHFRDSALELFGFGFFFFFILCFSTITGVSK